jgi:hypothetical protein
VANGSLNVDHYLQPNGTIHGQYSQECHDQGLPHGDEWPTYPESGEKDEQSIYNHPVTVNLDFLEFDVGLRSPAQSSLWHLTVSDRTEFPPLDFMTHKYKRFGNGDCTFPEDAMARQDHAAHSLLPHVAEG